ncbi:MAG: glycosyl hydrolase [Candidatus Tectomicrobia bacterium]|nr:glycosyl hydrolase [Candidatus Tectomicrobia bacterium]
MMTRRHTAHLVMLIIGVAILLSFSSLNATGSLTLTHIHGLSFSPDGAQLFIPSHHGLAIYSKGGWSPAPGPQHDYMGFSVTGEFFYSSGHPAPGSPLQNPFGLIRSGDGGRTWEPLGLAGESDFHLLATSYGTNAVYVYNPAANSRMPQPGLYVTTDDGQQWHRAKSTGVSGRVFALAVHPTESNRVAMGTANGLYLSQDTGDHFQRVAHGMRVLSLFFAHDGQHLWWSGMGERPTLTRLHWQTAQSVSIPLPPLERDAISYIAQNPIRQQEWAIATFQRDVYLSSDDGKTWKQIAKQGMTL